MLLLFKRGPFSGEVMLNSLCGLTKAQDPPGHLSPADPLQTSILLDLCPLFGFTQTDLASCAPPLPPPRALCPPKRTRRWGSRGSTVTAHCGGVRNDVLQNARVSSVTQGL